MLAVQNVVPRSLRTRQASRCRNCDKLITGTDYRVVDIALEGWPQSLPRNVMVHRDCSLYTDDPILHRLVCRQCRESFESTNMDERFCSGRCEIEYQEWQRAGRPKVEYDPNREPSRQASGEAVRELVTSLQTYVDRSAVVSAPLPADPTSASATPEGFIEEIRPFMPRNEQGVIVLFSMVVEQLGYKFVDIGIAFPDATLITPEGRKILVEFEYNSRNFLTHGHDPDGCDLVICWDKDDALMVPTIELHSHYNPAHGTWDFSGLN